jgi:taurine dioxygenase
MCRSIQGESAMAKGQVVVRPVSLDSEATYRHIEVRPLTGALGAEIFGADLSQPLPDDVFAEIHAALLENLVIFFRDQDITPGQHTAFGRRFGELHVHPYIPSLEGHPEIIPLGGEAPGPSSYARNANEWHTDLTYTEIPPMGAILHGLEIPATGGDTMFANMYAAYESLSDRIRHLIDDMTAVHSVTATKSLHELSSPAQVKSLQQQLEISPPGEHPVVRTHPESGRKGLFINQHFTSHLNGVSERESRALLNLLCEHVNQPEFHCRFRWRDNSIAFWDNRCTQHYAIFDYAERRRMHRVTVCGDKPY